MAKKTARPTIGTDYSTRGATISLAADWGPHGGRLCRLQLITRFIAWFNKKVRCGMINGGHSRGSQLGDRARQDVTGRDKGETEPEGGTHLDLSAPGSIAFWKQEQIWERTNLKDSCHVLHDLLQLGA
eukprot:gene5003-biopygen12915